MKSFFLTLLSTLCLFQIMMAQDEEKLEQHEEQWKTHLKIYIYEDGSYIATNDPLKESKEVVMLLLRKDDKTFKTKEGKIPGKIMEEILNENKSFNPQEFIMVPPCCPVYDEDGNYVYIGYTARCVWPCYVEVKGGKNISCCYKTPYGLARYFNYDIILP